MNGPTHIPDLHDSVLERVNVQWEAAEATIDLTRVPGGPLTVTASGLRSLELSHEEEWGPSVFVNHATIKADGGGLAVLEIEMQSGDTIRLVADRLVAA
jgi:hypothetical protein